MLKEFSRCDLHTKRSNDSGLVESSLVDAPHILIKNMLEVIYLRCIFPLR